MTRLSDRNKAMGKTGGSFLKGDALKKDGERLTVVCKTIRYENLPTEIKSPAIMDLEKEVLGCSSFPLNSTNVKKLAEKAGLGSDPDFAELDRMFRGKKLILMRVFTDRGPGLRFV
jgi:hypothetical protein